MWSNHRYLKKGYFDIDVPKEEKSRIIIKARPYTLYDGQLYKLKLDGVLWQCLSLEKAFKILEDFHEGPDGGHFGILAWILLLKKYYFQAINGPLCIKMILNYVKTMTFANI